MAEAASGFGTFEIDLDFEGLELVAAGRPAFRAGPPERQAGHSQAGSP